MSDDDGTVGGNEHHPGGVHLFNGNGIPIVNSPLQQRQRPQSLYNLPSHHSFHVDLPLYESDIMQRMGPVTPNAPMTPDMKASINHLNLIGSSANLLQYHTEYDFRSRSPALDLGPQYDERTRSSSRNPSRRHTLESSSAYFAPQPMPIYNGYVENSRIQHAQRYLDDEDLRNLPGPSASLMPAAGPSRSMGQHARGLLRTGGDYRHPWLRPDSSFSPFEVNYDAIMSTIPRSRGTSRDPSRSNSPHISRVSSRNRISLLGFRQSLSSSPAQYDGPGPSIRRQVSRAEEEHHNAILRQTMADSAEQLRESREPAHEELELPFLPPGSIVRMPVTPVTPATPFTDNRMIHESEAAPNGEDVQMTQ
jgi:hypothetical protein